MLKRKAFNRIFFTTAIFFVVFSIYSLKHIDSSSSYINDNKDVSNEIIYTLNKDNYISSTAVYVSKMLTLEDRIREKLEIMTKENDKNSLLPSYFKPILPQNTKVLDVVVEDSLVKVYFSKELINITEEQSEKMIEAIVYTIVDENILGIEIYVDNSMLKYVPHSKRSLPTVLTKDIGINKSYDFYYSEDIAKVFMVYYSSDDSNYYEVPVTRYLNDDREKIEVIFDEFNKMSFDEELISLLEGVKINSYEIFKDDIVLDINKDLSDREENLICKTIFSNYDVDNIKILINGEKKVKKNRKDT